VTSRFSTLLTATLVALFSAACDLQIPDMDALGSDVTTTEVGPSIDEILANEVCEGLVQDDFECGGDPVGLWEIVRSCPAIDAYDPLNGTCAELAVQGQGEAVGTVEFRGDGTYEFALESRTLDISFIFPLACFGGAVEPCNGANFFGTCFVLDNDCGCDVTRNGGQLDEEGTWLRFFSEVEFTTVEGELIFGRICRVGDIMRLVRLTPNEDELDWGFIMRRVDDLDD
jgi:hypothetical protein